MGGVRIANAEASEAAASGCRTVAIGRPPGGVSRDGSAKSSAAMGLLMQLPTVL
jgi:hypothetical protein